MGIHICSNKGPGPLQRGDNHKNVKMGWCHLNNKLLSLVFYRVRKAASIVEKIHNPR
jgi:hypothetical protein